VVHINPQVLMEDGEVVECSRRVAAILYLTPGGLRIQALATSEDGRPDIFSGLNARQRLACCS
jgi:hypothetical protein